MTNVSAISSVPAVSSNASAAAPSQSLDKDAFLRLLVTQLENQDPTKPMDNTQFISQMAQFSALEQMNNVSDGLSVLTQMQMTTQAMSLVGRSVTLTNPAGGDPITGKVDSIHFVSGV